MVDCVLCEGRENHLPRYVVWAHPFDMLGCPDDSLEFVATFHGLSVLVVCGSPLHLNHTTRNPRSQAILAESQINLSDNHSGHSTASQTINGPSYPFSVAQSIAVS